LARKISLSRQLHKARTERGLSVADVADRVGVSATSVYLWEQGRVQPRDVNLSALCRALKLPIKATRALAVG
jgi:transcriptional regulator with XRE-family HTH domain